MLLDYILLQLPTEKVIVKNYYLKPVKDLRGPAYILEKPYTFIYEHSFLLITSNIQYIVDLCKVRGWEYRDLTGELK